jgi:hypothetical protein
MTQHQHNLIDFEYDSSSPVQLINNITHNNSRKNLIKITCCVCLELKNPGNIHFCRCCEGGTVCSTCIKQIDKSEAYEGLWAYCLMPTKLEQFSVTQQPLGPHMVTESILATNEEGGVIEVFLDDPNFKKKLSALLYFGFERRQRWGYGNLTSARHPVCPSCRGEYTFLTKGYKMNQGENFRLDKMRDGYRTQLTMCVKEFLKGIQEDEDYEIKAKIRKWIQGRVNMPDGDIVKWTTLEKVECWGGLLEGIHSQDINPNLAMGVWRQHRNDIAHFRMLSELYPNNEGSIQFKEFENGVITALQDIHTGYFEHMANLQYFQDELIEIEPEPYSHKMADLEKYLYLWMGVGIMGDFIPGPKLDDKVTDVLTQFNSMTKKQQKDMIAVLNQ